jgi:hypothetical protein
MEMSLTPKELQDEFDYIVKDNEGAFAALSELLINEVESLCVKHDVTDPDEIQAIANAAHFNFEFKFGFYMSLEKIKRFSRKSTEGNTDENNQI